MSNNNWYAIKDVDKIDSPALIIYPERVLANIRTAINMVGDPGRLRPHVKTNKSPDACRMMMEAGISKFKCATIAEAEMLGQLGAADVLLAYQPVGPKIERFIALILKYPRSNFSCLVDDLAIAEQQASAFALNDLIVPVFIDLNIGMNRSGIVPGEKAMELYSFLTSAKGVRPAGIHAYDGHIREKDFAERKIACDKAFDSVLSFKKSLEDNGMPVPLIVVGGSPTFPIHAGRVGVGRSESGVGSQESGVGSDVECSPGTFIYWDRGYSENCPEQDFLPAAVLLTRVISMPVAGQITTDLGHKSVAAENELSRRVFFLNAEGLSAIGQSEEHLVLELGAGGRVGSQYNRQFAVGDILYGLPFHVCPTVALYDSAYIVRDGKLSGSWKNIARDRRLTL